MYKKLKYGVNLNEKRKFFTPTSPRKDGIVTVSNLKQLRIVSLAKIKTDNEDYGQY